MNNWFGQEITLGSKVFRGGTSGNGSTHKVGIVSKINEKDRKLTAKWKFHPSNIYIQTEPVTSVNRYPLNASILGASIRIASSGTAPLDGFIIISDYLWDEVATRAHVAEKFRQLSKDGAFIGWKQEALQELYDAEVKNAL